MPCLLSAGGIQAESPTGIQLFHLYCTAWGHILHFMKSKNISISLQQDQNQMHNGCYNFNPDYLKIIVEGECWVCQDNDFFLIFFCVWFYYCWHKLSHYVRIFLCKLTAFCTEQYQPQHFPNTSHLSSRSKIILKLQLEPFTSVSFSIAFWSFLELYPNHSLSLGSPGFQSGWKLR